MYILVRKKDNMIIGTAASIINKQDADDKGYNVYEVDAADFDKNMIGCILKSFEEKK